MLWLSFSESTVSIFPRRVRPGGVGFEFIGKTKVFGCENLIDALVVIFGIYGVDFPPSGAPERSFDRIRGKMKAFRGKILIDALVVVFGNYGVDFPPQDSCKRSLPRIHRKMRLSFGGIVGHALTPAEVVTTLRRKSPPSLAPHP